MDSGSRRSGKWREYEKKKAKVSKSKFQYRPKIGPEPIRGIRPTLAIHRKQMTMAQK
jgi:hypothetical protein